MFHYWHYWYTWNSRFRGGLFVALGKEYENRNLHLIGPWHGMSWSNSIPVIQQQPNKTDNCCDSWAKVHKDGQRHGGLTTTLEQYWDFFRIQHHLHNKAAANLGIVGHLGAKPMNKDDFKHLRQLAAERPKTKAGLIRMLWPEIKLALNAGHTIAEVLGALNKDGIDINYSTFRNRISRMKKKDIAERKQSHSDSTKAEIEPVLIHSDDPASAVRAQRAKKIKFDHDPFSTRIKDLV